MAHFGTLIALIIASRGSYHHSTFKMTSTNGSENRNSTQDTKRTVTSSSASGDSSQTSDLSVGGGNDLTTKRSRSVIYGRVLFVAFLMIVAGILGFLAYYFVGESEQALVEEQYHSITATALKATQTLAVSMLVCLSFSVSFFALVPAYQHKLSHLTPIHRHRSQTNKLLHGSDVMAKVASYGAPDASEWPFIWVDGYFDIIKSVTPTSAYTGLHLAPIVPPDVLPEWEDFAK